MDACRCEEALMTMFWLQAGGALAFGLVILVLYLIAKRNAQQGGNS